MKKFFAFLLLLCVASGLFGADDFASLNKAAGSAKGVLQATIKSWIWISALLPMGLGIFLIIIVKQYQERQEEQGQYQPKVAKYASLIGAFLGGIVICYILYGLIGAVFFGADFGTMWKALVTDFYASII